MDEDRARALLREERDRLQQLLADAEAASQQHRETGSEVGDPGDRAQSLTAEGVSDALVVRLKERLEAVGRAEERLANGTYGRSIRSGEPIPDERLEIDPTAELTVEEARSRT